MGFAVVLWGAGGWRLDAWFGLAAGFALHRHQRQRLRGGADRGGLDAWHDQRPRLRRRLAAARRRGVALASRAGATSTAARVTLPIAFTVASFAARALRGVQRPRRARDRADPADPARRRVRLGLTLWWLSRQRADLEALAASDPLTGLGNYRAFQEHLARARSPRPPSAAPRSASSCSTSITSRCSTTPSATPRATASCRSPPRRSSRTVGEARLRRARRRRGVRDRRPGRRRGGRGPRSPSAAAPRSRRCRSAGAALACSAGVAAFPPTPTASPQLLHAADGALYWAKRSGRDRVRCFDPSHVVALSLAEQRREVEALLGDRRRRSSPPSSR